MVRRIIEIDQEKCNGCGACAAACHEGAIGMVDGKAKLLRDDYCDGLGDCLPTCPTGAITFVEREAAPYDEAAVQAKKAAGDTLPCGCPGSMTQTLYPAEEAPRHPAPQAGCPGSQTQEMGHGNPHHPVPPAAEGPVSCLRQWPVQIKLLPVEAPFYQGAKLLIAADCTAFSRADFHQRFMRGRITLIGCPKLDEGDYAEKLTEIIRRNDIREVTVVRMEVPCCGGIQRAVETALRNSGKFIPWQVVTLGRDGNILD
ncbi:ATP-binding protein [Dysosmobacter sp.]|jgi:NAD-dependent dihydropyrimidine dehydrogenase PreA subunit|uniref:ATP-binding protein n=1 Tax=Dysosmobacter sp. TaxID=2591382 RepID=UPI003AB8BF7C